MLLQPFSDIFIIYLQVSLTGSKAIASLLYNNLILVIYVEKTTRHNMQLNRE